jgi:hypothetical protein
MLNGLAIATVLWCIPTLPVETCDVLEFNTQVYDDGEFCEQRLKWTAEKDRATGEVFWACKWSSGRNRSPIVQTKDGWECWDHDKIIRCKHVIFTVTDTDPYTLRDFQ